MDGHFPLIMSISSFEPGRCLFYGNEEHSRVGYAVERGKIIAQDNNHQLIN